MIFTSTQPLSNAEREQLYRRSLEYARRHPGAAAQALAASHAQIAGMAAEAAERYASVAKSAAESGASLAASLAAGFRAAHQQGEA